MELQRIAGDDVTYSTATAHEHNGVVYRKILYAFRDTAFGVAAGHAAVNLMTQLAQASRGDGDTQTTGWTSGGVRRNLLSWIESRSLDISTAAMVRGAIRRDIPWRLLNERARFVQFGQGRFQKPVHETLTRNAPGIGALLSKDKGVSNRLLFEIGVTVPDHSVIRIPENMVDAAQLAVDAAQDIGYPVVVKPVDTDKGVGISVNLAMPRVCARPFAKHLNTEKSRS